MTRSIECEFEIKATPEQVWQALSDADQICRWFAPYADSAPGPEGFVSLGWMEPDNMERMAVLTWDEPNRLVLDWHAAPAGQTPIPLPVQFELLQEGDVTRLKLVQNGFLSDESWDDEFESHSRGWATELRFLKYYLEHHFGKVRNIIKQRCSIDPREDILGRIVGPNGIFKTSGMPQIGDRFEITLPDGESSSCELLYALGKTDFVFVCDALDGGIVRIALEYLASDPMLLVWAISWNLAEDKLIATAQPWFEQVVDTMQRNQQEAV